MDEDSSERLHDFPKIQTQSVVRRGFTATQSLITMECGDSP